MKHLWSALASQVAGISMSHCGLRIDQIPEGDLIKEAPPIDCQLCMAATSWAPRPGAPPFLDESPTSRAVRIRFLETARPQLIAYLKMKLEAEDWHGCQDAASDLRDLDSELDGLRY